MNGDKVLPFRPVVHSSGHEPPLSDQELIRIRAMLTQFEAIKATCPIADKIASALPGKQ